MQSETNQSFILSSIIFPVHAIQIPHLHRPSTRRLTPCLRSLASIPPPTLESHRDLVSISGRIILRTNNQPPPLLRPAINRLNNINQLLLILQHPIQLIIISRAEIAHLYHTHAPLAQDSQFGGEGEGRRGEWRRGKERRQRHE